MNRKQAEGTLEDQVIHAAGKYLDMDGRLLIPHEVYHYTSSDIVKKILSNKGVCFRMTHYEDFEDKLEGKIVEVYCDLALERLYREKLISDDERLILSDAKIPRQLLFYEGENCPMGRSVDTTAYVCCFSKSKESEYMFDNYIRTKDKKGFCMEFSRGNLFQNHTIEGMKKGFRFDIDSVHYGEEVIEAFEKFILRKKEKHGAEADWVNVYGKPWLEIYMQKMQFMAKRGKYKKEQEVRLVLYKGVSESNCAEVYPEFCEDGKRYVNLVLPKNSLYNVYRSPNVTPDEDKEMRKYIRENDYRDIEWV